MSHSREECARGMTLHDLGECAGKVDHKTGEPLDKYRKRQYPLSEDDELMVSLPIKVWQSLLYAAESEAPAYGMAWDDPYLSRIREALAANGWTD